MGLRWKPIFLTTLLQPGKDSNESGLRLADYYRQGDAQRLCTLPLYQHAFFRVIVWKSRPGWSANYRCYRQLRCAATQISLCWIELFIYATCLQAINKIFNRSKTYTRLYMQHSSELAQIERDSQFGPWFNIKMSSYQYRKSHCGDKTVVRSSYLHNRISCTGKMVSLYWIGALNT